MTPKQILEMVVDRTYNGVMTDDVTETEKRVARILVSEGVLKIKTFSYDDEVSTYGEYRINDQYFAE